MKRVYVLLFLLLATSALAMDLSHHDDDDVIRAVIVFEEDEENTIEGVSFSQGAGLANNEPTYRVDQELNVSNAIAGEFTKAELEAILEQKEVKVLDSALEAKLFLNFSLDQINATYFKTLDIEGSTFNGTNLSVCVLDTGVDLDHPALASRIVGQQCFCSPGCCVNSTSQGTNGTDIDGHGTHVAGIIASQNTTFQGVAHGVGIVAVRVFNSTGTALFSDVSAAIDWCVTNKNVFNVTAISMSLGTETTVSSVCDNSAGLVTTTTSINNAVANNISVIVSSGNENTGSGISAPACITNATSVGAVEKNDSVPSYSNAAAILDMLAPGGDGTGVGSCTDTDRICAPYLGSGNQFNGLAGTSMAAPHVSAAVALLQSFYHHSTGMFLTPANITQTFKDSGKNITDSRNSIVFPRLDVFGSFQLLDQTVPQIALVSPTPANNTNTTNTTVSINATAFDIGFIEQCLFEVNNSNTSLSFTSGVSNTTCEGNITLVGKGNFSYTLYATDLNQNVNTTSGFVFINNSLPEVTPFTATGNLSVLEGVLFNLSVNASDANNDVMNISWFVNSTFNTSTNFTHNFSFTDAGFYNITLFVGDEEGNVSLQWNLSVNDTGRVPTIPLLNLSFINDLNLSCNYTFSDPDGDEEGNASILWYVNGTRNTTFDNVTSIARPDHLIKKREWRCEVTVVDNASLSTTQNSTGILVNNSIPIFAVNGSIVNETDIINLSLSASDDDNDTFTFTTNFSRFSLTGNNATWVTNRSDAGTYHVLFNASDSDNSTIRNVTFTIRDLAEFGGNGSQITANLPILIRVNRTENNDTLSGVQPINVSDTQNNTLVTFSWNFSVANISPVVDYAPENGTMIVRGLNVSDLGLTKTIFVNKSDSAFNRVCILDLEVEVIGAVSADCSQGNETSLACPGSSGPYTCAENDGVFVVSGLSNTAVKGFTVATSSSSGGGGGGGGGGGRSRATTTPPPCFESWICTGWETCMNGTAVRECFDVNACGTIAQIPATEKTCTEVVEEGVVQEEQETVQEEAVEKIAIHGERSFVIDKNILIVLGLVALAIVVSGLWLWYRKHRVVVL